jgi:hypothetical protein
MAGRWGDFREGVVSIITSSGRAARGRTTRATGRPLVAVLSDGHRHRHGVGSAVLRHLGGLAVDLTLIGCDADDSALLESWRNRDLVMVVDPLRAEPDRVGRVHRHVISRSGRGRLVVFAVGPGPEHDQAAAAGQTVDALATDIATAIKAEIAAGIAARVG